MSEDFLVTHVCPECNHIWLYPNVFDHACPSCGTTKPPVSVDQLAGRRAKAAKGETLDPITLVPDKGSELLEQFTSGVRELRGLIQKAESDHTNLTDTIEALETEAVGALGQAYEDSDESHHIRHLFDSAKALRNLHGRLRVAERQISALFILGDDAESYPSGLPTKKVPVRNPMTRLPGDKCPRQFYQADHSGCTGHLKESPNPHQLICTFCGGEWSRIKPPIERADASNFANTAVGQPVLADDMPCPHCDGTVKAIPQTPVYLCCNRCGSVFAKGDPQPLKREPKGEFTGTVIERGPLHPSYDQGKHPLPNPNQIHEGD